VIEQRIQLSDGRTLAAAEVGDPDGMPVLLSHGFPGSRLGVQFGAAEAQRHGIRLIAFDRPGWGASDPCRGRRLKDWPRDIAEAADRLGCPRFNLVGLSGGAPFALACAAALAQRVGVVALVCGLGPLEAMRTGDGMMRHNRIGLTLASRHPWLVRPAMAVASPLVRRFFDLAIDNLARHAGPADREVLADAEIRGTLGREFREAFRQGGEGASADALIYVADWGFQLASIETPVHLWHGDDDRVVPITMAHWIAARIPGVRANYHAGEGHFSIVVRRMSDIFTVLRTDPA
jgi:pimeloyl-ACP methyl ester carboxylesterase